MAPIDDVPLFSNSSFVPQQFHDTPTIRRLHRSSTRFGGTNDISALLNGSRQEKENYVRGLAIASVIIFAFFLVWACLLVIFRFSGRRNVGFLAGRPILKPKPLDYNDDDDDGKASATRSLDKSKSSSSSSSQHDDVASANYDFHSAHSQHEVEGIIEGIPHRDKEVDGEGHDKGVNVEGAAMEGNENDNDEQLAKKWKREARRSSLTLISTRIAILFSGVGVIVASVLFLLKGADGLVETMDDTRTGMNLLMDALEAGIASISKYLGNQSQVPPMLADLQTNITGWCPKLRDEIQARCGNSSLCDFSDIPFQDALETVKVAINETNGLVFDEAYGVRSDFEELLGILHRMDRAAEKFNWAFYVSAAFVVILDLLVLVYMLGVILAWIEKLNIWFRLSRSFVVDPVLLFVMFMSWLFSVIFLVAALVSADFCVDSPDVAILEFFERYRDEFNSIVYPFVIFFLKGCPVQNTILAAFEKPILAVDQFLKVVHDLIDTVANVNEDVIQQVCGTSTTPITALAAALDKQGHLLYTLFREVAEIFSCNTFHPIYTTIAYDAVCYDGVDGLTWIFATQLTMAVFSMIIVTLRSACHEPEYYQVTRDDGPRFWDGYRFWCKKKVNPPNE